MADLVSRGNSDRDVEQAIIALKKGTQLIKYCRKGRPKFCPFRLSADETTLIWYSHGQERSLKLALVSRIIPGQRTAVFRRYLRPEKDYLSFSLIYQNNGERSLDLICKDQAEIEVWLAGLKALISNGQQRGRRSRSEVPDWHDDSESIQNGRLSTSGLEIASSLARGRVSVDWYSRSDVRSEANMLPRTSNAEGFRISVSSTPSSSSQGSGGPDDIESLGDVYVWGELWSDATLPDGSIVPFSIKTNVLTPKPLESNVVLDVHQIACGVRHIALVTRQGEVFTWGEESGGRLGHGIERDFTRPHLVDFLAVTNVDFVSCGEFHTCAVSTSGDLFTWGDGTHNAGLLGHGTDISHWIPKRISGPSEALQVLSVSCGTWHSALTTSNGKLFTFGDGAFGVLGHGDRESVLYPREVQRLSGLKTIKVACGVWHTAAIVEVMNPGASGAIFPSKKLFTWGDGDKYQLGHGSKDAYLHPTCVSSLIQYNFHQIACGHTLTVALATTGHVITIGSNAHGQLGNPYADEKAPYVVQDKLMLECVEEISCGAHHVAVLTSRSEVYTWGKGANGRLGHGDTEDRKSPTLVEALRDRHVKSVSCGSNFTAAICIHKWVSGADQSVCSGCRQAFGFTRKRHNCYNCGLVHCHACSSKKALRAALAPTPGKPHRVCDACYNKLKLTSVGNASSLSKRNTAPRFSVDSTRERLDRGVARSMVLLAPTVEPVKYLEVKSQNVGARFDSVSMVRASQVPAFQPLKDIAFLSSLSVLQSALKPVAQHPPPPPPAPSSSSRPASPYSRRPSPPRLATPVFSRGVIDNLRKSNELLSQEVAKLQNQVKTIKQKCNFQDEEIHKLQKNAKEAALFAAQQTSKCKVAREVVKSITSQLWEIADKIPSDVIESESFKAMQIQASTFIEATEAEASEPQSSLPEESVSEQRNSQNESSTTNGANPTPRTAYHVRTSAVGGLSQDSNGESTPIQDTENDIARDSNKPPTSPIVRSPTANGPPSSETREAAPNQSIGNGIAPRHSRGRRSEGAREVTEQFEQGVYVTFIQLCDGTKVFRHVKFSKRRFLEQQAEEWWNGNKDRLLSVYASPPSNNASPSTPSPPPPADETNQESPSHS